MISSINDIKWIIALVIPVMVLLAWCWTLPHKELSIKEGLIFQTGRASYVA